MKDHEKKSEAPIHSPKTRSLVGFFAFAFTTVAVTLSLFQLYSAGIQPLSAIYQRCIHITFILILAFLLFPATKRASRQKQDIYFYIDLLLIGLAFLVAGYIILNYGEIIERQGDWTKIDVIFGLIATVLVIEACRRTIGLVMVVICLAFIVYAYFGPYMPEFFAHKGYSLERISTLLYLTTEGIYGLPLGVAATFVFIFVLFGSFLQKTGGGDFFINLAYALTGRMTGGPAKTAVLASGFMGSVSGSAIGNVVTTGSFTIPMMKKLGYKPHVAGAVEAAASTGGQLMPPIMGAGAFLMAEFTNTSYLYIIKIALIPAIMYFMTVLFFVHFAAKKIGFFGLSRDQLPPIGQTIKDGLHFLIPLAILIYVLVRNFSPMMAGFIAVVATFLAAMLRKRSRLNIREIIDALALGGRNAITVSVACAAAGIIVGMVSLTGLGLKFSSMVVSISGGVPLIAIILIGLASLVLGMGLPVTASYIVLVILAGPALMEMGVAMITAHMIVFWYSQDANVTPPVALASFAGAGVAGANPMKCAFSSWKIAKGLYIIPIIMAYQPLLLDGPFWEVVRTIVFASFGLIASTSFLEAYLFHRTNLIEWLCMGAAAFLMLFPSLYTDMAGAALFLFVCITQKYIWKDQWKGLLGLELSWKGLVDAVQGR
ncbi:MAG: TRAP transporter permease [Thermodesulfobacteriota bacterium]